MPRIKRWFPVSHDINHNPFMRELAQRHGLAGWRIWLEILSIADRNEGLVDCTSQGAVRRLSSAAESRFKVVSSVTEALFKAGSIVLQDPLNHVTRVVNYAEYHRTEERKKFPTRPDPTEPDLTYIKNKNKSMRVITRPPASKNSKKETDPRIRPFIDFFADLYLKHRGIKYVFRKGKDNGSVQHLLGTLELDDLKARAERFFETDDQWIKNSSYSIGVFQSQINKLVPKVEPPRREMPKLYDSRS